MDMPSVDKASVVIYGNGAMAKLVHSFARHTMNIVGFTVDDVCIKPDGNVMCGLPVVPFSEVQDVYPPTEHDILIAMGFIDMNTLRLTKHQECQAKGYGFTRYVHPSVTLHDDVEIAENCIVLDHVSIHPGCNIGHSTFISSNVNIGHDCILGEGNWVNSGVAIAGNCHIGAACFFGVNASVGNDLTLGARNFVAANTLINKSTQDDQVYISEPGLLFKLKSQAFLRFSKVLG